MKMIAILLSVSTLVTIDAVAREKRVNQVPNGNKFQCVTCHTGFGGPRNDFGRQIENGFLNGSGDVLWGEALAALDSDNDGKTNGEELQDAGGAWAMGQANPGDANLVSNPGDPNSTVGIAVAAFTVPASFTLQQNFPNPFNPVTTISFTVPHTAAVTLRIYNALGQPIRDLLNEHLQPGQYQLSWNGKNDLAEVVDSGIYLARLQSDGIDRTIRMLLLR
ncbi:T9SS type A sorting domain-containing protein [candidate division KSB1 bacterium]|nr:T9SS type A sorting domain-containing protein [candidate division KSB1 bacterium]